jgi:predicted DNA-binding transcriptional regulator YafY
MLRNLTTFCKDTPIYDNVRKLLDTITAPLSPEEKSCFPDRIVVPPSPTAPVPKALWSGITAALRENRVIAFEYQGAWDEEYCPRQVRPYQLLFDNGIWHLYGYAEERQAARVFSLPRIRNAVLTERNFSLPKHHDYRAQTGGSYFGAFAGQQERHFRVAFRDESIVWVQDRQWAEDQRIEEAGAEVIIDFTRGQYEKVFEWVLSQGCNARPLEPAELVEAWRDNARKMAGIAEMAEMAENGGIFGGLSVNDRSGVV